jgi:hypothetical protein
VALVEEWLVIMTNSTLKEEGRCVVGSNAAGVEISLRSTNAEGSKRVSFI